MSSLKEWFEGAFSFKVPPLHNAHVKARAEYVEDLLAALHNSHNEHVNAFYNFYNPNLPLELDIPF